MALTINNTENQAIANSFDHQSKRGIILDYSTDKITFNPIKGYIVGNPTIQLNRNLCECNANISINFDKDRMGDDCITHILPNLTRMIMIPNATSTNYQPTFDTNTRKPLNHYQWLVSNGQMMVNGFNIIYKHGYTLVEPIYLTKMVYVGTHSHTNMTNIKVKYANTGDTYDLNQDSTNLWEILKRELQLAGYKTTLEDTSWFNKCNFIASDITLLQNSGVGVNEVFTSATLYDVILKIGVIIDRIPKLYFNPDYDPSSTDASKREFILCFEEKELNTNPHIIDNFLEENISNYSESNSQGNDTGSIVCDAQNVETTDSIWYPSEKGYLPLTGGTDELILSTSSNFSIKVPKKIKCVEQVDLFKVQYVSGGAGTQASDVFQHLTAKCYEYNEWLNQDADVRKTSFYFKDDSNEINIPDAYNPKKNSYLFGTLGTTQYFFRVKFTPIINLKVKYRSDNELETCISQSETTLDSTNFGEYLENYTKIKTGTDIYITKSCDTWDDILKPGEKIICDGVTYYCYQTNIEMFNGCYHAQYSISSKRLKKSELVDASSYKDVSTIDRSKAFERLDLIEDNKLYVSITPTSQVFRQNIKYVNIESVLNSFLSTRTKSVPLSCVIKCFFDTYNGTITHNDSTTSTGNYTKENIYMSIPLIKNTMGNTVYYNIDSLDNLYMCHGGGYILNATSVALHQNVFNRFTDDFGKVKYLTLSYTPSSQLNNFSDIQDGDQVHTTSTETMINKYKDSMLTYPLISSDEADSYNSDITVFIPNYRVLKDTNEKLNISYAISFEAKENSKISKDFASYTGLMCSFTKVGYKVAVLTEEQFKGLSMDMPIASDTYGGVNVSSGNLIAIPDGNSREYVKLNLASSLNFKKDYYMVLFKFNDITSLAPYAYTIKPLIASKIGSQIVTTTIYINMETEA